MALIARSCLALSSGEVKVNWADSRSSRCWRARVCWPNGTSDFPDPGNGARAGFRALARYVEKERTLYFVGGPDASESYLWRVKEGGQPEQVRALAGAGAAFVPGGPTGDVEKLTPGILHGDIDVVSFGVATIPLPKWCCQRRLTITRGVRGLAGSMSHRAKATRRSASVAFSGMANAGRTADSPPGPTNSFLVSGSPRSRR